MNNSERFVRKGKFLAREMGLRAPEFPPHLAWLNCPRPLSLRDLRGKLVLLDFWTFCCVDCLHVLPDLAYLERRFANQPLVVIGVHSAKFANERDTENIRQAILRYDIAHPVVNDAQMELWRAYGVAGWPTLVLIDPEGYIVWTASGKGHRQRLERIIAAALRHYRAQGKLDDTPLALRREARAESPLAYPGKLAADARVGVLYIADTCHNRVVACDLSGRFLFVVGSGAAGLADGSFSEAQFNRPQGLALAGELLLVADSENHALRAIDLAASEVRTLAGTGERGSPSPAPAAATSVALSTPWDVAVVGSAAYIAMAGTHQVWRYDLRAGTIEVYAGTGREACVDGPRLKAAFAQPSGLASDGSVLYVADAEVSCVRAIDLSAGEVRTVVGGDLFEFGDRDGVGREARLQHCMDVLYYNGRLYVADAYNHKIKIINPNERQVRTWLGSGRPGNRDGPSPEFYEPSGLAAAGNVLFVADTNNHAIRAIDISTGETRTLPLRDVPRPRYLSAAVAAQPEPVELPPQTVAPGAGEIHVELALPPGHELTPGAPSRYAVAVEGQALRVDRPEGAIKSPAFSIAYYALSGAATLSVEALAYHCGQSGVCQMSLLAWRVPLTVAAGGARAIALRPKP